MWGKEPAEAPESLSEEVVWKEVVVCVATAVPVCLQQWSLLIICQCLPKSLRSHGGTLASQSSFHRHGESSKWLEEMGEYLI